MLFTPWRNEETDSICNFSSYEERFYFLKDVVTEQMKQYAVCSVELDKIQEQMLVVHDNNDLFDSVAPFTQNIQYKDKAKAVDFTENYDLSNDIGIPSTTTSHEPLILNEMQDQNYRQLVQTLKQKEKRILLPYFASHKNIS